ncbi:MAG: amidinotransferase [Saprospiraceae bacterium]|nr:amidinotransferase [Saprospiraceae bacterium]
MENNQITSKILMVRPSNFGYNAETALSNSFQQSDDNISHEMIRENAINEFNEFVEHLRFVGVEVFVVPDSVSPIKPDAIFPNNWVSMHQNGKVVLYPMCAPSRRIERNINIIDSLRDYFEIKEIIDLSYFEDQSLFLEGTGSMIFDRPNKMVYACTSPRTDINVLNEFCKQMGYTAITFRSEDRQGNEIYHTNVMMALGDDFAIICLDSIPNADERFNVVETLEASNKAIIEISLDQVEKFAGNMLQVSTKEDKKYLVMSEQAYNSLTVEQKHEICTHTKILNSPLYTIEKYGGGSARCMMAEIFLEKISNKFR